jgi:hypothetical protein
MLFLRALSALIALPGVVAFPVPALLLGSIDMRATRTEGVVLFLVGTFVLSWMNGCDSNRGCRDGFSQFRDPIGRDD